MAKELDPELEAYFEKSNASKQLRYDARIAHEILKFMGLGAMGGVLKSLAARECSDDDAFNPEWLVEHIRCPIYFRAIRDFHLEQRNSLPDPVALIHKWTMMGKWRKAWDEVWQETLDRAIAHRPYVAACFRPSWAEDTIALHNYEHLIRTPGLNGGSLIRCVGGSFIIFSTLKDLVRALLESGWRPQGVGQ